VKAILKANTAFLLPYSIFLIVAVLFMVANSKGDTHLEFNAFHAPFFDVFFSIVTHLGDGILAVFMVLILVLVKYRWALLVGLSVFLSSAITQTLKHTIFDDVVRPKKFFEGISDLYFVPGIDNHLYNSFPSGHTTCAFSLFFALAVMVATKKYKFLFLIFAILIGYSRIYLSQHFLEDVSAGSLIGILVTIVVGYYIQKSKKHWMEKSLMTVLKT
jgi:membrane-associated phospholipid phosphatase